MTSRLLTLFGKKRDTRRVRNRRKCLTYLGLESLESRLLMANAVGDDGGTGTPLANSWNWVNESPQVQHLTQGSGFVGPNSIITTVAGNGAQGYSGDGVPATAASFSRPSCVAVDSAGNLFIADAGNNRIRQVDHATGLITTIAGNGTFGYSGDGGPATAAGLNGPQSVAVDSVGNLFIADANNQRIRKVDHATGVITTIVGNGTWGYSGDGGPATAATLGIPLGVALDFAGNLFIADTANNRVREVNHVTGVITTVAGDETQGYSGDGGPATAASLNFPEAVALDSAGNLFIADSNNGSIREVKRDTGVITTVAYLWNASSVTVDSAGNLFIPDSANNCIREVDHATGAITIVAGNGSGGYSGDGGLAAAASFSGPSGVTLDSIGNLFIADSGNNRIREVDQATGVITTVAGDGTVGDDKPATAASLNGPSGVAVDSAENLFIADTMNSSIRDVDHATGVITTVAGNRTFGYSGDGGPAIAASLNWPKGVAVDSAGNVFIADTTNGRIREVDHDTGMIITVAGSGTSGYSGDGGPATAASLDMPWGVAVDSSGNIFIAEQGANRIRKVDHTTGLITTAAGDGTSGYSGDGGPATAASLFCPTGVAVDSVGNIFIADNGNNRVREVDHATGLITTVAGAGTDGYSGDGGPAAAASFRGPTGVTVDSAGNLFIVDFNNNRIREVDHATGAITTVAGNGTYGYSGDGGQATAASLYCPEGVAVDPAGNLFIADFYNNRIREVFIGPPTVIKYIKVTSAPLVVTAISATPNPVTGTTTNLSVLANDVNTGESSLTYTWSVTTPSGATTPAFSINGSNAAKNTTATFSQAGTYGFTVTITDPGSLTTTNTVVVQVLSPWHNYANPCDVDGNGMVTPLDALLLINYLNAQPGRPARPATTLSPTLHYDVTAGPDGDGDGQVTALDLLTVINFLNAQSARAAEGEAAVPPPGAASLPEVPVLGTNARSVSAGANPSLTARTQSTSALPSDGEAESRAADRLSAPVAISASDAPVSFARLRNAAMEPDLGAIDARLTPLDDIFSTLASDVDRAWRLT
ncbi:MAG: dockerin type I domain-containing protein [Planctomycetota bacterium]|nr:dockerin type I domain-containing protein [Planctomycetota bacterium]